MIRKVKSLYYLLIVICVLSCDLNSNKLMSDEDRIKELIEYYKSSLGEREKLVFNNPERNSMFIKSSDFVTCDLLNNFEKNNVLENYRDLFTERGVFKKVNMIEVVVDCAFYFQKDLENGKKAIELLDFYCQEKSCSESNLTRAVKEYEKFNIKDRLSLTMPTVVDLDWRNAISYQCDVNSWNYDDPENLEIEGTLLAKSISPDSSLINYFVIIEKSNFPGATVLGLNAKEGDIFDFDLTNSIIFKKIGEVKKIVIEAK